MSATELFSDTADFDRLTPPQRQFPVVVTISTTYVLWVDGDSEDDAAARLDARDSATVYELAQGEPTVDGGIRVEAVDQFNHWLIDDGYGDPFGPWRPGETTRTYAWRSWAPEHVRLVEEDIAREMAKGLPTREAVAPVGIPDATPTNSPPPGRECPGVIRDADGVTHRCARWSTHLGIHRTAAGRPEWLDDGTFIRQGSL